MSQRADIFLHFCDPIYRKKMTIEERAKLMLSLHEDLDIYEYDIKEKGKVIGQDLDQAIKDLRRSDENEKKK